MWRAAFLPVVSGLVVTNVKNIKSCTWTAPTRTVSEAFEDAFGGKEFHWNKSFDESANPKTRVTGSSVVRWIDKELLGGLDPFAETKGVPVPWHDDVRADQLEAFQYMSYTRRQVCYIVAKSLTGSTTKDYDNGLKRFLHREGDGGCLPRKADFGRSFWALLAACSADPMLENNQQGPLLIVMKGAESVPDVDLLRDASCSYELSLAKLRACRTDDGGKQKTLAGVPVVPAKWCSKGVDFMSESGGYGQAAQVMTQKMLGGHLFGVSCGLGGGQSERMAFRMPEAAALSFFLSRSDRSDPQVHTPLILLGARLIMDGSKGSVHATEFSLNGKVPFTSDLVEVTVGSHRVNISTSKAIWAFSAETQYTLGESLNYDQMQEARTNRLAKQRETRGKLSFGRRVQMWYRGVALTSYPLEMRPVLKKVIKSLGVGPWSAGLSFGDSAVGFLAMWVGHAAAAGTWGDSGIPPLDYYIYSAFTENPGNQCLVHSFTNCKDCLAACHAKPVFPAGFWLPQDAFIAGDRSNPCLSGTHECPLRGFETLWWNWNEKNAGQLWEMVEYMLWQHRHDSSKSVFDLVMDHMVHLQSKAMAPQFPTAQTYQ